MTSSLNSRRGFVAGVAATTALFHLKRASAQDGDIVIGQSAPMSGLMASAFKEGALDGQKLGFDEINRKGGINGRKIRHVILDDAFDPKRSLENAKTLVEKENAVALFGFVGTAQTAAVLPFVAERKVPLIACYSGSPALRAKPNPYFFTTQASYVDELHQMVRNLMALQLKRLAVIYQNNELGKGLLPIAERVMAEQGGTLAVARSVESDGSDANAAAQHIAGVKPQATIILAAGPSVVGSVKAIRQYVPAPIYTISLGLTNSVVAALGDDARGVAVTRTTPYPWRAVNTLTRDFTALMQKAGKPLSYDLFAGYINTKVIAAALKGAGRNPTHESVTQAMERLGTLDLGGYKMNFGPNNRHGSKFVEITIIGPRGTYIK
jgi:ABC-type branched-subunit amino acid transport system substrate-binding protein